MLGEENVTESDSNEDASNAKELQDKIKGIISKLDPVSKKAMKSNLEAEGLPTAFSRVTDIAVLTKILQAVSK